MLTVRFIKFSSNILIQLDNIQYSYLTVILFRVKGKYPSVKLSLTHLGGFEQGVLARQLAELELLDLRLGVLPCFSDGRAVVADRDAGRLDAVQLGYAFQVAGQEDGGAERANRPVQGEDVHVGGDALDQVLERDGHAVLGPAGENNMLKNNN